MTHDKPVPDGMPRLPVYALSVTPESQITVYDLWLMLWSRRLLITALVVCFIAAGVVYIVRTPVEYRADVFLLPPLPQDVDVRVKNGASISGMEIVGVDVEGFTPERLYGEFRKNLLSRTVQRDFFEQRDLLAHYLRDDDEAPARTRRAFNEFNAKLVTNEQPGSAVRVSFDFEQAEAAAVLLNDYVALVNEFTIDSVYSNVDRALLTRTQFLKDALHRKRILSKKQAEDRIAQLKEAIVIASAMGLENHSNLMAVNSVVETAMVRSVMSTPLYLRGTRSLQAEVERLKERELPEAFIEDYRELEDELAFLQSLELDKSNLRAAIVDEAAVPPDRKIRPRRAVILVASALLGGLVAVFVALMLGLVRRQQQRVAG